MSPAEEEALAICLKNLRFGPAGKEMNESQMAKDLARQVDDNLVRWGVNSAELFAVAGLSKSDAIAALLTSLVTKLAALSAQYGMEQYVIDVLVATIRQERRARP